MFKKARLKLTAWYLAMIMLVSVTFSVVIYRVLVTEVIRVARSQRVRVERLYFGPGASVALPPTIIFDTDLLTETEHRLLLSLILINAGILALAASVGYFLAGKTLQPIQIMVDEQGRFVTDASHELRTPLTALKSSLEVYLRDPHPTVEEAERTIAGSVEDVNRLQKLSESLLDLSTREVINPTPTTAREIAEGASKRVQVMAKMKRVTVAVKGGSRHLPMVADVAKLTEALVILLDNAIKYSRRGGRVTLAITGVNGEVKFAVQDSGIGILAADLPHIFERFYRADAARTHASEGGYGLGLSIAKVTVEQHHGTITVASEPGKGSTFTVTIPSKYQPRMSFSSPFRIFSAIKGKVERYGKA